MLATPFALVMQGASASPVGPWAWGFDKYEQLCLPKAVVQPNYKQLVPAPTLAPASTTSVAAGLNHSLFRTSAGQVYMCGQEYNLTTHATPVQVAFSGLAAGATISAVAAGASFSVALASDNTVWAWGTNASGQLGNNSTTDSATPVQVKQAGAGTPNLTGVTAVAAGRSHVVARKSDGTVWAWGANASGQLGNGTTTDSSVAVQVLAAAGTNLTGVNQVGAGGNHSQAIIGSGSSNSMKTWGDNSDGQLGDGTTTNQSYATAVSGLSGIVQAVGGDRHTLALLSGGTVAAWGSDADGQLGNGTGSSTTPVTVGGLTGVTKIAAGPIASHSLAIVTTGPTTTVKAWGWNEQGQLGNGTFLTSTTPVLVVGMVGATDVAAGGTFSLAV